MSDSFNCWKCGARLDDVPLPLARLAECPQCRAELHVCRMCVFFDPSAAQQCREPVADPVSDKQRANFCGYFAPDPAVTAAPSTDATEARRRLEALFGADAVDGGDAGGQSARSPEEIAREQLDKLFRK